MKASLICRIIVIALFLFVVPKVKAQSHDTPFNDSIVEHFLNQAQLYPQEKIHLQIDKPHYLSGERLWLKAFLVSATLHTPNQPSRYIYVELINPLQEVKARIKIRPENDSFHGYIQLPEDLIEGKYILRAYTAYMRNWDEGYWPNVPIYISDPQAADIHIVPTFEYTDKNKVLLTLSIAESNANYSPKVLTAVYNKNTLKPKEKNNSFNFSFDCKEGENVLLVECDKYKKFISIPSPQDDYEISFFPEGGNLLQETANCVAFKALFGNGNPANVNGYVIDEKGNNITEFTTYHDGMGLFYIRPEVGVKYYAVSKDKSGTEKKIELPNSTSGIGMRINSIKDNMYISVSSSPDRNTDSLYLVMHTRGIPHYVKKWDNTKSEIILKKESFLPGILHILLINNKGQTLSERLVFCNNDNQTRIDKTITTNIKTRDRISVDLQISDQLKKSLEADLLVSVTDNKDVDANSNNSILSTLLLTSDIRGNISNPNYYFEKKDVKTTKALDMLMLTHGWRRYNIPDIILGKYEKPKIPVEIGQEISGRVIGGSPIRNKPEKEAQVNIASVQSNFFDVVTTDDKGRFYINHFEFPDSTSYLIQTLNKKGKNLVELVLDKESFPPADQVSISDNTSGKLKQEENTEENNDIDSRNDLAYINKANKKYTYENGMRLIFLDAIEIRGKKPTQERSIFSKMGDNTFDRKFIEKTEATVISDVLRHATGFIVNNGQIYSTRSLNISGEREPVKVFIDGIHIQLFEEQSIDELMNIQDIDEIVVIKSPGKAMMLGPMGNVPSIVITTKTGDYYKREQMPNIAKISPLGYQKPAEFYSPKYDTEEKKKNPTPDLRTTIYWNPSLKSPNNGKVTFDFYAADSPSEYTMIIEGITKDGKIIRSVDKLDVSKSDTN